MNRDKFRFYLLLGKEILFFPYLYFSEWKKNRKERILTHTIRKSVSDSRIYVVIHEWGGYPSVRKKKIPGIQEFECGLKYQLERFKLYKGEYPVNITLTISDAHLCKDLLFLKKQVDHIITVPNAGMDFSGYDAFYQRLKEQQNSYVILTNSSVNAVKKHFLDGYIQYMDQNPDIGILGVSYNSRCYQSLIYNNFNPHIQSFFLLTTIEVLNEIVELNHQVFPGKGVRYKLLLIRKGELALSSLALKLGYALAVVQEDGSVLKFDRYTGRDAFLPGDMRIYVNNPNSINPIV